MAGNLDGNILGTKPVIGSKSDGMGQGNADGTVINLLKRLQNSLGLGSFGFGFDGGFNVYSSEAIRNEGVIQIKEFSITAAADAGLIIVATITGQGCWIEGIVEHSDGVLTGNLTSAAIKGGASQVIEFISAAVAIQADIDAENKQVSWAGEVWLPAGATIVIDLQGTGSDAVDLTIPIKYRASADGGYLA